MVNAPVGFQCPNCAAVSNPRGVRQSATRNFGSGIAGLPPVTRWVFTACVAIFIVGSLFGLADSLAENFGMWPIAVASGQWYRLITATFLHAGILHILFNMYALYVLGPGLERYLGSRKFATLYFLSALGGSTCSYLFSNPNTLAVGASGAIFGLLTATIVVGKHLNNDVSQLLVLLAINAVLGFSGGIDWRAHFGGAIVGAAIAAIYVRDGTAVSRQRQSIGIIAVSVLLIFLIVFRTQSLL